MRGLKAVAVIALLMGIFIFLIVPIEDAVFPQWISADLVQFLLIVSMAVCAIVLIR